MPGETLSCRIAETRSLAATDGFVLDDGRIIGILPKPELLMKITHDQLRACRLAYRQQTYPLPD